MKTSTFMFWWQAVPNLLFEMFSVSLGYEPEKLDITDEERCNRISSFFKDHPQCDKAVEEMLTIMAKRYITSSDTDNDIEAIESDPLFVVMKEEVDKHKCGICMKIYVSLLISTCPNFHMFCDKCMGEIVRENKACPFKCSEMPLRCYQNKACIYDISL